MYIWCWSNLTLEFEKKKQNPLYLATDTANLICGPMQPHIGQAYTLSLLLP